MVLKEDEMNETNGRIAEQIRLAREAKGWSMGRLDREAKLPNGSVGNYERNGREPSLRNIRALADALDVDIAQLVS